MGPAICLCAWSSVVYKALLKESSSIRTWNRLLPYTLITHTESLSLRIYSNAAVYPGQRSGCPTASSTRLSSRDPAVTSLRGPARGLSTSALVSCQSKPLNGSSLVKGEA
ncbi:unnamed protein product [Boreogadus saida]